LLLPSFAPAKVTIRNQTHDLEHDARAHQGGIAGLIVGRSYLDHVAADQIQAAQPVWQADGLAGGNSAKCRGAGAGCRLI
jgi:hypothetical protein